MAPSGADTTPTSAAPQALLIVGGFAAGLAAAVWFVFGAESADGTTLATAASVETTTTTGSTLDDLEAETRRLRAELDLERARRELAQFRAELGQGDRPALPDRSPFAATTAQTRRQPPTPSTGLSPKAAKQADGERTLAFWNRLNEVILEEASMRLAPSGGVTAASAGGFVESRIRAGEFAMDAIDGLDARGVDTEVVALAELVRDWYANGVRISKTASALLSSDAATRRGAKGASWQADEMQHNAAVQAVNQRGAVVREQMSSRYGLAFPPLE